MDNVGKFIVLCIVFPVVYLFVTLRLSDLMHENISMIMQLNFGVLIGVLLYLALKK